MRTSFIKLILVAAIMIAFNSCASKRVIVKDCRPLHQDYRECELVGEVEE